MQSLVAEAVGTMILFLLGDGAVANVVLKGTKNENSGWLVITVGWGTWLQGKLPIVARPTVTAGLMWAPLMRPTAYTAMVTAMPAGRLWTHGPEGAQALIRRAT